MRRVFPTLVIAALAMAWAGTAAWAHDEEGPLEGVYEFLRVESPQGPQETEKGMLIVNGSYICHIRVAKARQTPTREDSPEQRMEKAAYGHANSACGTFSMEGDKVDVHWLVSVQPGNEANSTTYILKQEEGTLKLAPAQFPDFQFVYKRLH